MRKFTLSLLSGLFFGFVSYVESSKCDPQIGDDSQKGPPGIKTIDLAYLKGAGRTIENDETSDSIITSGQMGKGRLDDLLDDVENRTTASYQETKSECWLQS